MNHTPGKCRSCGDAIHGDRIRCQDCEAELRHGTCPPASRITASRPGREDLVPDDTLDDEEPR